MKINKKHFLILISVSITIKILYLLFSLLINSINSDATIYNQYINIVKKADSHWYQSIAEKGYPEVKTKKDLGTFKNGKSIKQSKWAFFPFYPLLNKINFKVFKLNFDDSAFLLSLIFSIMSILGMYWFGLIFYNDQSLALYTALILFCSPFTFYFSMFYTEAIYLTFMIFSFIVIYYNQYLILSLLLIPLVLLRPNGIFILIPLYLYHLETQGILIKYKLKLKEIISSRNLFKSISFLSGVLTFLLFLFYQYKKTAFLFAFIIAQKGWNRELSFPLLSFFNSESEVMQINSMFTIIIIIYAIIIRKKLPLSLTVLIWISLMLPLFSGSVMSMTRFVSVIFPLFLIFSKSLYQYKYKLPLLIILLIFHFLSFYTWVIGHSISY